MESPSLAFQLHGERIQFQGFGSYWTAEGRGEVGRQRRGVEERFPNATVRVHEDEIPPIRAAHHPIPELAATTGDPLGLDRGAEHRVFSALS